MPVIFTSEWAAQWIDVLRQDESYALASETWEGEIVLRMHPENGDAGAAVFLDTHRGVCRDARVATADDLAGAQFVLSASRDQWQKLLEGGSDPMVALMRGQLRLERGKLSTLMGYTKAAKQMLKAAMVVRTEFPPS